MKYEYLLDLMVRMAHHSTAIEGNSLTQGEVKSILIEQYVPRAMELKELYEVLNYADLLPYLMENRSKEITVEGIRDVYRIIMAHFDTQGGAFKTLPNIITGAGFTPAPPSFVLKQLKEWTETLSSRLNNAADDKQKVQIIMEHHLLFEKIHPFTDGNGRTGRALMIWSCLKENLIPIIIRKETRSTYINALSHEDVSDLIHLAEESQEQEKERRELFVL